MLYLLNISDHQIQELENDKMVKMLYGKQLKEITQKKFTGDKKIISRK
jgi:hypothetical protein